MTKVVPLDSLIDLIVFVFLQQKTIEEIRQENVKENERFLEKLGVKNVTIPP